MLFAASCSRINHTGCARGRKESDTCCWLARYPRMWQSCPWLSLYPSSFPFSLALPIFNYKRLLKAQGGVSQVKLMSVYFLRIRAARTLMLLCLPQPLLIQPRVLLQSALAAKGRAVCPHDKRVTGASKGCLGDNLSLTLSRQSSCIRNRPFLNFLYHFFPIDLHFKTENHRMKKN